MTTHFNGQHGLIIVRSEIFGPSGSIIARMALDTGATQSLLNVGMLASIGFDPSLSEERTEVTTGSSVEYVPSVIVHRMIALGLQKHRLRVLAHTLPMSSRVDGLIGLDFLRGHRLVMDFPRGQIDISPSS